MHPPGPPSTNRSPTHVEHSEWTRILLNKVPEVTALFWVVQMLSTAVGETAANVLNANLGLGLSATTAIMTLLLAGMLIVQFASTRHIPGVYWLAVVLISVVGTLFSDNLVDNFGISLWTTSAIFGAGLAASFFAWFRSEHTLSVDAIVTRRREAYYWLTVLFTFALGTSAGDLVAERLAVGHLPSAMIFGGVIAATAAAFYGFGANAVMAFWAAYIITRPFGASMGDLLTASTRDGGLGLSANGTSAILLVIIVACVVWFTIEERRERHEVAAP